jgi:hypothetical protein
VGVFAGLGGDFCSPSTQRRKVRGETIESNALSAAPSGLPNLTRRLRSWGVTLTRRGSLARRISFWP